MSGGSIAVAPAVFGSPESRSWDGDEAMRARACACFLPGVVSFHANRLSDLMRRAQSVRNSVYALAQSTAA
ncbi:hypothetical protein LUX57_01510 [Actinomadura madurae]|uniref:hypothetical protein n=1 Tax=Actinomadura madurae TaxID=1993 RepID=UPI0020D1FDAF|nr:hypothetical protein [Actinomadura madurae]MCP9964028.1 hypothetical protein [Actinomadura madurae]